MKQKYSQVREKAEQRKAEKLCEGSKVHENATLGSEDGRVGNAKNEQTSTNHAMPSQEPPAGQGSHSSVAGEYCQETGESSDAASRCQITCMQCRCTDCKCRRSAVNAQICSHEGVHQEKQGDSASQSSGGDHHPAPTKSVNATAAEAAGAAFSGNNTCADEVLSVNGVQGQQSQDLKLKIEQRQMELEREPTGGDCRQETKDSITSASSAAPTAFPAPGGSTRQRPMLFSGIAIDGFGDSISSRFSERANCGISLNGKPPAAGKHEDRGVGDACDEKGTPAHDKEPAQHTTQVLVGEEASASPAAADKSESEGGLSGAGTIKTAGGDDELQGQKAMPHRNLQILQDSSTTVKTVDTKVAADAFRGDSAGSSGVQRDVATPRLDENSPSIQDPVAAPADPHSEALASAAASKGRQMSTCNDTETHDDAKNPQHDKGLRAPNTQEGSNAEARMDGESGQRRDCGSTLAASPSCREKTPDMFCAGAEQATDCGAGTSRPAQRDGAAGEDSMVISEVTEAVRVGEKQEKQQEVEYWRQTADAKQSLGGLQDETMAPARGKECAGEKPPAESQRVASMTSHRMEVEGAGEGREKMRETCDTDQDILPNDLLQEPQISRLCEVCGVSSVDVHSCDKCGACVHLECFFALEDLTNDARQVIELRALSFSGFKVGPVVCFKVRLGSRPGCGSATCYPQPVLGVDAFL